MRLAQNQPARDWQSPMHQVLHVIVEKPNPDILIKSKRVCENRQVTGRAHESIFYSEGNVLHLHMDVNYALANTDQSLLSCIVDIHIFIYESYTSVSSFF